MKGGQVITAADLAPLLRGGWRGPGAAWAALDRCAALVYRVVGNAYHRGGGAQIRSLEDAGELLSSTVVALLQKAERQGGLALPEGFAALDLSPWLARVLDNQARSVLRALRRQERVGLTGDGLVERAPDRAEPAAGVEPSVSHDLQVWHDRIRTLLDSDGLPPVQALGWVLLSAPELLLPEWVERACGLAHQGHLDTARGLARGPAETMDLLGGWLEQHLHEPRSRASRRHLAWLLRSEDRGEPEAWRAANPDEAARAQDLLRKWAKRFAPRIQALVQELEP